jgi:hypothetical protein
MPAWRLIPPAFCFEVWLWFDMGEFSAQRLLNFEGQDGGGEEFY